MNTFKPRILLSKLTQLSLLTMGICTSANAQLTCPSNYTAINFTHTGTVQTFVIPADSDNVIARVSAAGGGSSINASGGMGSAMEGNFDVSSGDILQIIVGGAGSFGIGGDGEAGGGGGGGASMVGVGTSLATATPIMIAGGGGGAGEGIGANGGNGGIPGGKTTDNGIAGSDGTSIGGAGGAGDADPMVVGDPGAIGGNEMEGGLGTFCSGGGGGLNSDGSSENGLAINAQALLAGAEGGSVSLLPFAFGGFGGGGAPEDCGGGGGGYAGGGGGGNGDLIPDTNGGGGGGGSLNNALDAINLSQVIAADTDGMVEICYNTVAAPPPVGNVQAVPVFSRWGAMLLMLLVLSVAITQFHRVKSPE